MYFSAFGGNYLKAQMQNNNAKVSCELYKREITKKHIHSLATIHKNIRDMQDFLKDIKANSGYCKDIQKFSSIYQSNFGQAATKIVQEEVEVEDLNTAHEGRKYPRNKTSALSKEVFESGILDFDQRARMVTKRERGTDQADDVLQIHNEKSEQNFERIAGGSLTDKNTIMTGDVLGRRSARRSYRNKEGKGNTKATHWLERDENLMETDRRASSSVTKHLQSGVDDQSPDMKESQVLQKEVKLQRSPSFLQTKKILFNGDNQGVSDQNAETQPPGSKTYKARYQPSEPQQAWSERPAKNRESPTSSSKVGLTGSVSVATANRSQTAPAKASRLKLQVKSASFSERKFDSMEGSSTAKNQSSRELKKLNIHVSLSKTERRRTLQELICSSTVTPDRSFLERERQTLLKDKVSKFFESLFDQVDTVKGKDEEEISQEDEDLQQK